MSLVARGNHSRKQGGFQVTRLPAKSPLYGSNKIDTSLVTVHLYVCTHVHFVVAKYS